MAAKKNLDTNMAANASSPVDTNTHPASKKLRSADAKATAKSSTTKKAVTKDAATPTKKAAAKKASSKKASAKNAAPASGATKKAAAKKAVAKKAVTKKAVTKKATAKTSASGKTAAKKSTDSKPATTKKAAGSKTASPAKPAKKDKAQAKKTTKPAAAKKTPATKAKAPAEKKAVEKKAASKKPAAGKKEKASAVPKAATKKKTSGKQKIVEHDNDADALIEEVSTEEGRKKRKYTRRSKKAPVAVPKYQGKQGLLLKKKSEQAAPLKPRVQKQYGDKDLDYFRTIIVQKIHDANEELLSIEERLNDSSSGEYSEDSTYSLHMADQGTDAMEREKAYLFAARERKFISHLTDALQRIKSGNYGICIVCGNLIEKGRLEAVPHARMCVNCKQETKTR